MIALRQDERERFAAFLDQEAATQEGLATQLAGLPAQAVGETMAKKYRTEALAFRIVATWLRSWEELR